jgi:ADP-ribosylglycohydrolase
VHDALDPRDLLADELAQRRQSGFDVTDVEAAIESALANPNASGAHVEETFARLEATERRPDWPYVEVDDPDALIASIRRDELPPTANVEPDALEDRIHGAWLGRTAGCLLGKPVEGWSGPTVRAYLERTDAWPIDGYLPRLNPWPEDLPPMKPSWREATRGQVRGAARDDDLDYTVVALLVLERTAGKVTASDVADEWIARIPFGQLYTAERAAYRSLVLGLRPPATARYHNPYREWVGALIRADAYALVASGDPYRAARNAACDASVSHVGTGVAAAMWAAAVISVSVAGFEARTAVTAALACVPRGSRLDAALRRVIELHDGGTSWEAAQSSISQATAAYSWVHAIPCAATVAAAMLWGDGDFERTIGLAVASGGDTDSNAATAGSACGASVGASRLPDRWVQPLEDRLRTSVAGVGAVAISELAARTVALARRPAG